MIHILFQIPAVCLERSCNCWVVIPPFSDFFFFLNLAHINTDNFTFLKLFCWFTLTYLHAVTLNPKQKYKYIRAQH